MTRAAKLLNELFEAVWEGTRTLDEIDEDGDNLVLGSTGDDGFSVLTLSRCAN